MSKETDSMDLLYSQLRTTRCPECGSRMDDGWLAPGRDDMGWYNERKYFSIKEKAIKTGFSTKWAPAKHCPSCGTVVFKSQGFKEAQEHPERYTPSYQKRQLALILLVIIGGSALLIGLILFIKLVVKS